MHYLYTYYECAQAAPDDTIAYWVIALLIIGVATAAWLLRPRTPPPPVLKPVPANDITLLFNELRANATAFNRPEYHLPLNEAETRTIAFLKARKLVT